MDMTQFIYPFYYKCTFGLFPVWDFCEKILQTRWTYALTPLEHAPQVEFMAYEMGIILALVGTA